MRTICAGLARGMVILFFAVAAQAAPFAYIANRVSNTVTVIDTATNATVATIPVGTGRFSVAVNPNGAFAYVTNAASNDVSVVNTATNAVVATIPVGTGPDLAALNPSGSASTCPTPPAARPR